MSNAAGGFESVLTRSDDGDSKSESKRTSATAIAGPELLVLLAAMPPEQLGVCAGQPDRFVSGAECVGRHPGCARRPVPNSRIVTIPPTGPSWTLTAADFVNAHQLADKNEARAILMLGPGAGSLSPFALRDLANAVLASSTDLALPCYDLPPHVGLINSAILYPLTRALFASRARFPLAIDLGLSLRMAERLAVVAQRFAGVNGFDAPVWPVNEAAVAGFTVNEIDRRPACNAAIQRTGSQRHSAW